MTKKKQIWLLGTITSIAIVGVISSCGTATGSVPSWLSDNFEGVTITASGSNYVITTDDLPDHQSKYWPTSNALYTASFPAGNTKNPNEIEEQSITLTIPASPEETGGSEDTVGDVIGIGVDGVVFFNNEAAPGDQLSDEAETFDGYNGHPQNTGKYHYHVEPTALTDDSDDLIGVLLDGFAVFGRKCPATGTYPTDLDGNNGHKADTGIDGLGDIYHYHVADLASDDADGVTFPVITGSYGGTPGTAETE